MKRLLEGADCSKGMGLLSIVWAGGERNAPAVLPPENDKL
jgi:hypothetical protein